MKNKKTICSRLLSIVIALITVVTLPSFFTRALLIEEYQGRDGFVCSYVENENSIEIVGCTEVNGNNVVIPNTIANKNVTILDGGAFETLPIHTIKIPETVTTIGGDCFFGTKIESLELPDSVVEVGKRFAGDLIKKVNLPDGIKELPDQLFAECASLESIEIPNKTESIGSMAFYNCSSLETVTFRGNSVRTIGLNDNHVSGAFGNCSSLKKIELPDSVMEIEGGTFSMCTQLEEAKLSKLLSCIPQYTFDGCRSLKNIAIPEAVKSIGRGAFRDCTSITTIAIPTRVNRLEEETFEDCYSLSSVSLPSSIRTIEKNAFKDCTGLQDVFFSGTEAQWESLVIEDGNDQLLNAKLHYNEDITDSKFEIGKDNNSYQHFKKLEKDGVSFIGGFYNVKDYDIEDSELKAKLINLTTSNGELGLLLDEMYSPWNGSCYGASCTMGLHYLGLLPLSLLTSDNDTSCYYELAEPFLNQRLLDAIEYFQLSQFLDSYGKQSNNTVQTIYNLWSGDLNKGVWDSFSNSDFYQLLIKAMYENKALLMTFYDKENKDGHAILATDIKRIDSNTYEVEVYDLNDNSFTDTLTITVNDGKYTANYKCENNPENNFIDDLSYLSFMPLDSLSSIIPTHINSDKRLLPNNEKTDRMNLGIKLESPFVVHFSDGSDFSYDGERFSGDIPIYNFKPIASSEKGDDRIIVETDRVEAITVKASEDCDIQLYDVNQYYSVVCGNTVDAKISFDDGITLSSEDDYTFDCAVAVGDETNVKVAHIGATTNGEVNVNALNSRELRVDADAGLNNWENRWYTKDDQYNITGSRELSDSTFILEEDGTIVERIDPVGEGGDSHESDKENDSSTDNTSTIPTSGELNPNENKPSLNGIVKGIDGKWAMYKGGKVDTTYTGVAKNEYGWWRVKDGYVDFNANGIYKNENGWWKTTNGKVTFKETGVFKNEYGWWRVENSKVNFKANGIYKNAYGWWKTTNGKVTFKETGIYKNEYGWWRVENSKVNFKANGIYKNPYGWWKTTNGKVTFKENGVFKNEHGWWKVKNSKVDFKFTGIASNKNGKWYIKNGKVDFSKNGKVKYNGTTYSIKNGKVQ